MRATIFGISALALAALASPAGALPLSGHPGLAPDAGIVQARVVSRTVVRGPRCRTVITKRRGPLGRTVIVRKRRCF